MKTPIMAICEKTRLKIWKSSHGLEQKNVSTIFWQIQYNFLCFHKLCQGLKCMCIQERRDNPQLICSRDMINDLLNKRVAVTGQHLYCRRYARFWRCFRVAPNVAKGWRYNRRYHIVQFSKSLSMSLIS